MNRSLNETTRRSLFWRLWWRSISVKRPQALLAIASLLVGAALASTLLNLYGDVRRKMTQEFRGYGPNAVIAPGATSTLIPGGSNLMDEAAMHVLQEFAQKSVGLVAVPVLHGVMRLKRIPADPRVPEFENVVVVGTDFAKLRRLYSGWRRAGEKSFLESNGGRGGAPMLEPGTCAVGAHIAARMGAKTGDSIGVQPIAGEQAFEPSPVNLYRIVSVISTGTSEDDQVFLPLGTVQRLMGTVGKISLVQVSIPGETPEVERTIHELAVALPGLEVRPIRQIVYSEGRVLDTIRWLLLSLTSLILVIMAICVMATMTAIVFERRKDIGVMKALGASDSQVMRLFLAEGAALGLAGGVVGFLLGGVVAHDVARRLFGVDLSLTWWTFPFVCSLTMLLAFVAASFPVRMVRAIEPAVVLKGE